MDPEANTKRFRFLSWRRALSFIFWSVLPAIYLVHEMNLVNTVTWLVRGKIQKQLLLILGFAVMNMTSLLALPFLKVNLMIDGKISLDATGLSLNWMTALAFLTNLSAMVWSCVDASVISGEKPYELALSISTNLIIATQIGTGLLIFNIAVTWVLEENNAIDKATSSKDLLSAYSRLISKYRNLRDGSGGILFFLCFNFGLILFTAAWLATIFAKNSIPLVLITLTNCLLLKDLTSLANGAYERLFLYQDKLR